MPNHRQPLPDSFFSFASSIRFVINFIADIFALTLVLAPIVAMALVYYDQAFFNGLAQAITSKNWTGVRFMLEALARASLITASCMVVVRRACFWVVNGYASGVVTVAPETCAVNRFYDESRSETKNH